MSLSSGEISSQHFGFKHCAVLLIIAGASSTSFWKLSNLLSSWWYLFGLILLYVATFRWLVVHKRSKQANDAMGLSISAQDLESLEKSGIENLFCRKEDLDDLQSGPQRAEVVMLPEDPTTAVFVLNPKKTKSASGHHDDADETENLRMWTKEDLNALVIEDALDISEFGTSSVISRASHVSSQAPEEESDTSTIVFNIGNRRGKKYTQDPTFDPQTEVEVPVTKIITKKNADGQEMIGINRQLMKFQKRNASTSSATEDDSIYGGSSVFTDYRPPFTTIDTRSLTHQI